MSYSPFHILQGPRSSSPRRMAPPINSHRPTAKPLAGHLLPDEGSINPQQQSRLMTIPREIRDIIYGHALRRYENHRKPYSRSRRYVRPGRECAPRIAVELLQACRAIYMETFLLPVLLNAIVAYHGDPDDVPAQFPMWFRPAQAPWQFCAVTAVDISLQQAKLEDDWVGRYAIWLMAAGRHTGLRVTESPVKDIVGSASSAKFLHLKTFSNVPDESARIKEKSLVWGEHPPYEAQSMAERLELPPELVSRWRCWYVPRRITKLTLRLGRTDWWTWGSPPDSDETLALDPAFGESWKCPRPSTQQMKERAAFLRERDASSYGSSRYVSSTYGSSTYSASQDGSSTYSTADYSTIVNESEPSIQYEPKSWGAQVCMFPSLKTLDLVLETFAAKKKQLEEVVRCAQTWTFPMAEGGRLQFHSVERSRWHGARDYGYERHTRWISSDASAGEFEVRTVRFERVKVC